MASMCIKTKRLDVAAICVGHTGNVRASKNLRKVSESESGDLVKLAKLAVDLSLNVI